jgi:hypothetical protein
VGGVPLAKFSQRASGRRLWLRRRLLRLGLWLPPLFLLLASEILRAEETMSGIS